MAEDKFLRQSSLAAIFGKVREQIERNRFSLQPATDDSIGGVKPGTGLAVGPDGTLSVTGDATVNSVEYSAVKNVPLASDTTAGVMKTGSGLKAVDGVVSVDMDLNLYIRKDEIQNVTEEEIGAIADSVFNQSL